jgi:LacI family transcriptional regulator
VVVNSTDESRFFREMKGSNFPFCTVNTAPAEAKPWMVGVDDAKLSEQATSHFINLGHRRIGMLYTLTNFENGRLRLLGYKNALKNAGIPFDPLLIRSREDLVLQATDNFDFGATATETLLRQPNRPTAILSMSDEAAIGAMRTLQQASLSIPRDMSLICFDDSKLAAFITPSLTVVNVPNVDIGFKAASIVHRRIAHKDFRIKENLSSSFNGGLLLRESCGPAPKDV